MSNILGKRKYKEIDYKFISPSDISDILFNQPLDCYLKYYKHKYNIKETENIYNNYIYKKGKEFEDEVINKLEEKHTIKKMPSNSINYKNFQATLDAMNEGHNIIYQGVLYCEENKLYGSPDLLVKANYIDKLFPVESCKVLQNSAIYSDDYIPIEIKNSTLFLTADNIHLMNGGRVKYYKGQLYIYQKILNIWIAVLIV